MRMCLLVFVLTVLGYGCTSEPSTLGLLYGDFGKDYGVVLVDTITVDVSTVLLDSKPTSAAGTLLAGGYGDH